MDESGKINSGLLGSIQEDDTYLIYRKQRRKSSRKMTMFKEDRMKITKNNKIKQITQY